MAPWLEREVLITVKAYPNPSKKHGESVCVAGITKEEGWVRLYPVNYRELAAKDKFKKYQIVGMRIKRRDDDPWPESFTPQIESFKFVKYPLPTDNNWISRKRFVLPTLSKSMCHIQEQQKQSGKSLGAIRVRQLQRVIIKRDDDTNDDELKMATQLSFWNQKIESLELIPHQFKIRYLCEDKACTGHEMKILDWEIGELYRKSKKKRGVDAALEVVREKLEDKILTKDNEIILFVGNHSRFPQSFMILGMMYPRIDRRMDIPGLFD